jgi:hypothetical protein
MAFPDTEGFPGDSIRYFVGHQTPSGGTPYVRDLGNLFGVAEQTPNHILNALIDPNMRDGRLYEDTLRVKANQEPRSIAYTLLGTKKDGGMPNIYPQIQSERQFFEPIYTNSHNAYAYGGMPEVFPQVGTVNYQPPVNMPLFMDEGGTTPPPDQYPVSEGVNGMTSNFVSWLKNKSMNASDKNAMKNVTGKFHAGGGPSFFEQEQMNPNYMHPVRSYAKYGGLPKAQVGKQTPVTTNGENAATAQNNAIDYDALVAALLKTPQGQRAERADQPDETSDETRGSRTRTRR